MTNDHIKGVLSDSRDTCQKSLNNFTKSFRDTHKTNESNRLRKEMDHLSVDLHKALREKEDYKRKYNKVKMELTKMKQMHE